MKLTASDKEILKEFGYPAEDMGQIERATLKKYTTYKIDDKKATLEEILAILNREEYLSGIGRSAFHWSAVRETENGKLVYFDSSRLFK